MSLFEELQCKNPALQVKHIEDNDFRRYGKIVSGYDFTGIVRYMLEKSEMPLEGNIYKASVAEMEIDPVSRKLSKNFFGGMEIEIGYCNGRNSNLNGLEYHKGSEINIAVTDLVLLLGDTRDIESNQFDSRKVEAFYVPKGMAIELYQTTLHFAPCKVSEEGFKCVVILPKGTNEAIDEIEEAFEEDVLLFMRNKWLLAHPDRKPLIEKGAYPGITGDNIQVIC